MALNGAIVSMENGRDWLIENGSMESKHIGAIVFI
jgi:hypothetical protein